MATYAGGRVEVPDALELIGAVSREAIFELVELVAGGHSGEAIERLESSLDSGSDPEQLMRGLVAHLRHLFLLQQGARARDEWGLVAEEIERLEAQTHVLAATQVVRTLDLLADAQLRIRNGADARMQLELVAAKLGRPALDPTLEGLATRVANLERGVRPAHDASRPIAPQAPPAPTRATRPPVPQEGPRAATPADHPRRHPRPPRRPHPMPQARPLDPPRPGRLRSRRPRSPLPRGRLPRSRPPRRRRPGPRARPGPRRRRAPPRPTHPPRRGPTRSRPTMSIWSTSNGRGPGSCPPSRSSRPRRVGSWTAPA